MNVNRLNILLVDDDPDDCWLFEEALARLPQSHTLSTVHNGERLMQHLSNTKNILPDILFLDLNIPLKNGFECLTEIKQNKKFENLPVVIISTALEQDKISSLFKTGAHVYIRKPNQFTQLVEVIYYALPMVAKNQLLPVKLKYILNA